MEEETNLPRMLVEVSLVHHGSEQAAVGGSNEPAQSSQGHLPRLALGCPPSSEPPSPTTGPATSENQSAHTVKPRPTIL